MENKRNNTIIFNSSKRELFSMNNGFTSLLQRLGAQWEIKNMKGELSLEKLKCKLWITAGPREKFSKSELEALKNYLDGGGSVLVMLGEGGETKHDTNINFLLEELGIMVNDDSVFRNVYYNYIHPQEVLVTDGVRNSIFRKPAGHVAKGSTEEETVENNAEALTFVYPFGATLNVMKPAVTALTTGSVCIPLSRPVLAFHRGKDSGKLVVSGSCHIFSDQYIDKEDNSRIMDVVFQWLTSDDIQLNQTDAENPEIAEYNMMSDIFFLSEQIKVSLEIDDEGPADHTTLFDFYN